MAPSLLTPSMLDTETFEAILFVTDLLEDLGAKYVIGGSVASIAHGLIRTTMDADLVTTLESDQQAEFIAALSEQFYVDEAVVREAIQRRSHFSLIHLKTMFKVDIFLVTDRPFDRQQIERRISVPLGTDSTDGWQGFRTTVARHSGHDSDTTRRAGSNLSASLGSGTSYSGSVGASANNLWCEMTSGSDASSGVSGQGLT